MSNPLSVVGGRVRNSQQMRMPAVLEVSRVTGRRDRRCGRGVSIGRITNPLLYHRGRTKAIEIVHVGEHGFHTCSCHSQEHECTNDSAKESPNCRFTNCSGKSQGVEHDEGSAEREMARRLT